MTMINTTKGDIPLDCLEVRTVTQDEPEVVATATEYWLDGECVRRDVNLALKPKDIFQHTAQEM